MRELIEKTLKESDFEGHVARELEAKYGKPDQRMDWGAIIAVVLPIVIDVLIKYVLPYVIEKVIPWIIDQLKKKTTPKTLIEWVTGKTNLKQKFKSVFGF